MEKTPIPVSGRRTTLLVESILMHADALNIDEKQIASLSRIYWSPRGEQKPREVVSNVVSILSPEQFGAAISRFVEEGEADLVAASAETGSIEVVVAGALEKLTKDRSLVEIELATKVADRLIAWAKVFLITHFPQSRNAW